MHGILRVLKEIGTGFVAEQVFSHDEQCREAAGAGTVSGRTIFALASGAVPAGVAVVRVSGPDVRAVLETVIDSVPEPRLARLYFLRSRDRSVIDQGIVLFFPGPKSFTGEDVAEFHIHGGRAVVAAVLGRLGDIPGCRLAEPGEFTRRAFTNGRLDLTEVEGLGDLIQAETEAQRRQAVRQAGGGLRERFDLWRTRLTGARALVEAELDFADEDVPVDVSPEVLALIDGLMADLGREAAGVVKQANDLTNELLTKNAENLRQANAEIRTEMERGVFDIEAVQKANDDLIATIEDSLRIADEGKAKRAAAEQSLIKMEGELKETLAAARAKATGMGDAVGGRA